VLSRRRSSTPISALVIRRLFGPGLAVGVAPACFGCPLSPDRRSGVGLGQRLAVLLPPGPRELQSRWALRSRRSLRVGFAAIRSGPSRLRPRQPLGGERLSPRRYDISQRADHLVHHHRGQAGSKWKLALFEETADGVFAPLPSESGAEAGVLPYCRRRDVVKAPPGPCEG